MEDSTDHNLVTRERQMRMLEEVLEGYRKMNIPMSWEEKPVPLHNLIATQDAIEKDKYERVVKLMAEQELQVPILVEEHYARGRDMRYLIDGHCRTRALIELGRRRYTAFVIRSPAGEFDSNLVRIADEYGGVPVKDLPFY